MGEGQRGLDSYRKKGELANFFCLNRLYSTALQGFERAFREFRPFHCTLKSVLQSIAEKGCTLAEPWPDDDPLLFPVACRLFCANLQKETWLEVLIRLHIL